MIGAYMPIKGEVGILDCLQDTKKYIKFDTSLPRITSEKDKTMEFRNFKNFNSLKVVKSNE